MDITDRSDRACPGGCRRLGTVGFFTPATCQPQRCRRIKARRVDLVFLEAHLVGNEDEVAVFDLARMKAVRHIHFMKRMLRMPSIVTSNTMALIAAGADGIPLAI